MTLDSTARRANIKDSLKKYFTDNLVTVEGIHLTFDTGMATPQLVQGKTVNRWVAVNFGEMDRKPTPSTLVIEIVCATRRDNEGFVLAQLTDTVMGYLNDEDTTDGLKRITLYRSRATGAWTDLGNPMLVVDVNESKEMKAPDNSKYIILTCKLVWMARL